MPRGRKKKVSQAPAAAATGRRDSAREKELRLRAGFKDVKSVVPERKTPKGSIVPGITIG